MPEWGGRFPEDVLQLYRNHTSLWTWKRLRIMSPKVPQGRCCGRVNGLLLQVIQSLYCLSKSLVCIARGNSDPFPVREGLHQGCSLSSVMFISFMDRIAGLALEELRHLGGAQSRAAQRETHPLDMEELRWLGHLVMMPPKQLTGKVFWACPARP